jgi:hypothetical protein
MNIKKINISLMHIYERTVYEAVIMLTGDDLNCSLLLTSFISLDIKVKGHDFFKCLINLRTELEKQNYYLLCNGARRDVCCGGMLREYTKGRRGNIMRLGKYLHEDDEVNIFDYAEPELVGSISEQKEFYKIYCRSLPDYPNEEEEN